MLELASQRGSRESARHRVAAPADPTNVGGLASFILWEGTADCRNSRNPIRKPNRSPVLRSPGKSGMPGASAPIQRHIPPSRPTLGSVWDSQLVDAKLFIRNYTFGIGTLREIRQLMGRRHLRNPGLALVEETAPLRKLFRTGLRTANRRIVV
jgi:hypothetical protein